MRWAPGCHYRGTAWKEPTWREERYTGRVFMPVGPSVSFDGKTWEPVDEDHDRREWDSICRAFLSTKLVKQLDSNGSSFVERAPRIIDGQAALIERVRVLIADTMMSAGELADEIEEVLDSLANEPQTGQPNRPPK